MKATADRVGDGMSETSRTFGLLPFENLEPRRFEDLVRQLAYDFRPWRALEATGRAEGDEGFDARGSRSPMRKIRLRPTERTMKRRPAPRAIACG
jgi:hypothetical protein